MLTSQHREFHILCFSRAFHFHFHLLLPFIPSPWPFLGWLLSHDSVLTQLQNVTWYFLLTNSTVIKKEKDNWKRDCPKDCSFILHPWLLILLQPWTPLRICWKLERFLQKNAHNCPHYPNPSMWIPWHKVRPFFSRWATLHHGLRQPV